MPTSGVARQFRGCGTRHFLVGTIIAINVEYLNGGCGTAKSVAALPHPGYASDTNPFRYNPQRFCISISQGNVLTSLQRISLIQNNDLGKPSYSQIRTGIQCICISVLSHGLLVAKIKSEHFD